MAEGDEWQGFLGYIASGNVDKAKELLLRRGTRLCGPPGSRSLLVDLFDAHERKAIDASQLTAVAIQRGASLGETEINRLSHGARSLLAIAVQNIAAEALVAFIQATIIADPENCLGLDTLAAVRQRLPALGADDRGKLLGSIAAQTKIKDNSLRAPLVTLLVRAPSVQLASPLDIESIICVFEQAVPKVAEGKPRLPVRVEEDLSLVRRLSIDAKDNKAALYMGLRSLMLAVQMTPPAVDELMRRIESGSVEIGAMLPKKSLSHVSSACIALQQVVEQQRVMQRLVYAQSLIRAKAQRRIVTMRNRVYRRIFLHERKYLEHLGIIVEYYMLPVQKRLQSEPSLCTIEEFECVFGFVDRIKDVHRTLSRRTAPLVRRWPLLDGFAEIYGQTVPQMTNYDQYSASWPRLVETLEKLRKNPSLKHLTQLHNGMDLLQRLSMPLAYFVSLKLLAEEAERFQTAGSRDAAVLSGLVRRVQAQSRLMRTFGTFAVPLELLLAAEGREDTGVPTVVQRIVEQLSQPAALASPLLFQPPSDFAAISLLRRALVEGSAPPPGVSPRELSAVLLAFFTELPEPLIPRDQHERVHSLDRLSPDLLDPLLLPNANRLLLRYICRYLYEVLKNAAANKLTPALIAGVIIPALFREAGPKPLIEVLLSKNFAFADAPPPSQLSPRQDDPRRPPALLLPVAVEDFSDEDDEDFLSSPRSPRRANAPHIMDLTPTAKGRSPSSSPNRRDLSSSGGSSKSMLRRESSKERGLLKEEKKDEKGAERRKEKKSKKEGGKKILTPEEKDRRRLRRASDMGLW